MKITHRPRFFIGFAITIFAISGVAYLWIVNSGAFVAAKEWATQSRQLAEVTGSVELVQLGFSRFNVGRAENGVRLSFTLKVKGQRDNATAFVSVLNQNGTWRVRRAELVRFGDLSSTSLPVDMAPR